MKKSVVFGLLLVAALGLGQGVGAQDSLNVTRLGQICVNWHEANDVAISGNHAYVADGDAGLRILDISNPVSPVEVGFIETPGNARTVVVSGSYAYVADYPYGLRIINISDPALPLDVAIFPITSAMYVALSGNYAYVLNGYGLYVIDVSNPAAPIQVGFYNGPGSEYRIDIAGRYVYIAEGNGGGLRIVDIADPTAPFEVGSYFISGWSAWCVKIRGNYAYLGGSSLNNSFKVFDVSNPAAPQFVAQCNGVFSIRDIDIFENYAYTADDFYGIRVINISNPYDPTLVGSFDTPGAARGIAIFGRLEYVYVADYNCGLRVINVSTTSQPIEVGSYNPQGFARSVVKSGNFAYIADEESGLVIVDVSNPNSMRIVGNYVTPERAYGVAVAGNYAYVGDLAGTFSVIDVSNPNNPVLVGSTDIEGSCYDIAVADDFAYLAVYSGAIDLRIIDVRNPLHPFEVGSCVSSGHARAVAKFGNYAYVASGGSNNRLNVFDISDPATPTLAGFTVSCDNPTDIAVSGEFAYVTGSGLRVLNIAYPEFPAYLGQFSNGLSGGVAISEDYAFVGNGDSGLRIINVANPAAPTETGFYNTLGSAFGVAVSGNLAYLADGYYFGIYDCAAAIPPPLFSINLTPLNPPIIIPANGGSFNFNISVVRNAAPQAPYTVWCRIKYPDQTYTPPTLGPVTINTLVGVTITRLRTQTIPGSWTAGINNYLGYVNTTYSYPAIDSSSFIFNKYGAGDGGATVWEASCTGEPFPGERSQTAFIPSGLELSTSPNPFNPTTTIRYKLPAASLVHLQFYDTAGRLVSTLVAGWREAGTHQAMFAGTGLAAGVYLVRLQAGSEVQVEKVVLLK